MFGLLALIDLQEPVVVFKAIYFVVLLRHPPICCSLRIPYKQVLRAGCPALVDSHTNIVKVASSNPAAARVVLTTGLSP